jgi:hypothetical protein
MPANSVKISFSFYCSILHTVVIKRYACSEQTATSRAPTFEDYRSSALCPDSGLTSTSYEHIGNNNNRNHYDHDDRRVEYL